MAEQKRRTIVLGNFDGLHLGHQQLIRLGRQIADLHQEELAVFTFYPQIQASFDPDFCYLLTETQKETFLLQLGVEQILTVPFEENIAHTSAEDFIAEILVQQLRAHHVVVGFNYTFGYKGSGTATLLQQLASRYDLEVTVMEPYQQNGITVSSSEVRSALREGKVELANQLLGYHYCVAGSVVYGNQIGRTIGFPTANIAVPSEILLPANGVYAVMAVVEGKNLPGILNIGVRPTIDQNLKKTVEVHIFDFDQDLYGKQIMASFCYFLRGETKFAGLDALKQQLEKDEKMARVLFSQK